MAANMKYDIRAEFPDNRYYDFEVGADSLSNARDTSQRKIMEIETMNGRKPPGTIHWRGQVAFVDREP